MDTCFFRCPQYCLASSGSRVSQTDASLRADNYKITNYGVMLDITEMAEGWFTEVKEDDSFTFADALMHNNLVSMNQALQGITDISVSVFVSGGRWTAENKHLYRPGDLFHGLTLGPVVCCTIGSTNCWITQNSFVFTLCAACNIRLLSLLELTLQAATSLCKKRNINSAGRKSL